MSRENIEICRRLVDGWNRGNRHLPDAALHSDVEVVSRFRPEPYRGRDGFNQWVDEIEHHFEEWRLEVGDWRDAGDRVVALGDLYLRGRTSGLDLHESAAAVVKLEDGKLLRLELFADQSQALEAAGLGE